LSHHSIKETKITDVQPPPRPPRRHHYHAQRPRTPPCPCNHQIWPPRPQEPHAPTTTPEHDARATPHHRNHQHRPRPCKGPNRALKPAAPPHASPSQHSTIDGWRAAPPAIDHPAPPATGPSTASRQTPWDGALHDRRRPRRCLHRTGFARRWTLVAAIGRGTGEDGLVAAVVGSPPVSPRLGDAGLGTNEEGNSYSMDNLCCTSLRSHWWHCL
jgi:hypothetical protein